jgi:hydroxyethylthiazole kinase-like uncharacterized protein yjeF
MIPLYNTSQIRQLDSYAVHNLKVPGIVLMENASMGIFEAVTGRIDLSSKKIGIVCGKGNNGGDGLAVARHFSNAGYDVKVVLLGKESESSPDCKTNFQILNKLKSKRKNLFIRSYKSKADINWLKDSDLIIDAIIGSGFTGTLKEPYNSIISLINIINSPKCAIDVPTGLNADTGYGENTFNADLTITLGEFKKGLFFNKGFETSGEVILKEIGIGTDYFNKQSVDTYLIEPEDVVQYYPKRSKSVNKYSAGKVLTIAGSYKYPGAAVLTSQSSLISGAGASILAIPESANNLIHKNLLEVVVETYGNSKIKSFNCEALNSLDKKIKWADVVAVGPGLTLDNETKQAVRELLVQHKFKFAVIDADALNALDKKFFSKINLKNCILTPHLGEFSRLIEIDAEVIKKNILEFGGEFSLKHKCILVLKGAPTIIFNPKGEVFINTTGNSGMAKFGSGDVLTGIIAGFLAQNKNLEAAAISGVYLHSLSADLLLNKKPVSSYQASEIMLNLPNAINFLEESIV